MACLPAGVTSAVDAGSTGWGNYPALRDYIIQPSHTRLYAFVHLCATGLTSLTARIGELQDLALCASGSGHPLYCRQSHLRPRRQSAYRPPCDWGSQRFAGPGDGAPGG